MNHRQSLRLTPSNSPFFKASTPKSPTKSRNEEPGLQLKKVIGTTTSSANGFDCLPAARQFAYTAGAAAVVCTVDDDLQVTQRFFRARPTAGAGGTREVNGQGQISPTPNEARSRVLGNVRDHMNGSPLGASTRDWSDSPGGKSTTAKDRVKAATSVALSPNAKWVALGETGYKPRILIFSNKGESSESPICALSEHTFGVHALAFSPDSRFLASLGTVNDGFIYLWTIDDRTGAASLHASNKCTVTVNRMVWVGRSLLTVGLRFVKCWRLNDEGASDGRGSESSTNPGTPRQKTGDFGNSILSPRHKFLPGKNSLLGDLIDGNFVAALPVTDDRAIICTEAGDICMLSDCHGSQTLTATSHSGFRITAALTRDNQLIVSGTTGKSKNLDIGSLGSFSAPKTGRRQTISPNKPLSSDVVAIIATAAIGDAVVELDSKRRIRLSRPSNLSHSTQENASEEKGSHRLTAHNEAVLGVQRYNSSACPDAEFMTFSSNGSIHIWSGKGDSITSTQAPLGASTEMYDAVNELRAVAALPGGSFLATGDRYGTLSILDSSDGDVRTQVRAHSAEIAQIVSVERAGTQLVVTASRDRTVQMFVFRNGQLELLQTMDEHAAAVNGLLFAREGEVLLSCSTDRTIVVRDAMERPDDPSLVAYMMLRTITLKSSPTSMCLRGDDDEVLVATADRNIGLFNIKTGQAGFGFKCSDAEGGEATAMSKILYAPSLNGNPTIVGVSSGDKSVRLYSEYGSLIARDWGHTEGITDAVLLETSPVDEDHARSHLITVAADSTVFIWDTASSFVRPVTHHSEANGVSESPAVNKLATPIGPPLRKVLSFTELSRFKRNRSVDEAVQESPSDTATPTHPPPSPPRLKKKTSRVSVAQPPRLEPSFRSNFADSSRRRSLRKRSPSPPSPRSAARKEVVRKPSLGMSLRSKSSDNVLTTASNSNNSSFGSLNSSTESVCRTLRAYRKKLTTSSTTDSIAPETLRELEKELKLTARMVGEKSQGKNIDEAMMSRLLDQASEKIVSRLDERIKERVESEVRKSGEGSPTGFHGTRTSSIVEESHEEHMEAVAGALEEVSLGEQ